MKDEGGRGGVAESLQALTEVKCSGDGGKQCTRCCQVSQCVLQAMGSGRITEIGWHMRMAEWLSCEWGGGRERGRLEDMVARVREEVSEVNELEAIW